MGSAYEIQLYSGKVTQVIDPHNFWLQIGTVESLEEFSQFEVDIEKYCHSSGSRVENIGQLEEGQYVLVDCIKSDGIWQRGQVARINRDTGTSDIFYLDYGKTELVSAERICASFPDDFKSRPPQGVRCVLAGIQPIAKQWTSRGIRTFKSMTENKTFQILLLKYELGDCEIALYTTDGEDGRSVTHILLEEELGLPTEVEVPQYVRDIKDFYPPPEVNGEMVQNGIADDIMSVAAIADGQEYKYLEDGPHTFYNYSDTDMKGELTYDYVGEYDSGNAHEITAATNTEDNMTPIKNSPVTLHVLETEQSPAVEVNSDLSTLSPEIDQIAGFDIGQIDRTRHVSADVLHKKTHKAKMAALLEEVIQINEEVGEQATLAGAAGYGGIEELRRAGRDHMNHGPELLEKITAEIRSTRPQTENEASSEVNSDIRIIRKDPAAMLQDFRTDAEKLASQIISNGACASSSFTTDNEVDHQTVKEIYENDFLEVKSEDPFENCSFSESLNTILTDCQSDPEDAKFKLEMLLSRDLSLNKAELLASVNTLLYLAVRQYKSVHDLIPGVLSVLGLQDRETFLDCVLTTLKKLSDTFLKVSGRGSQCHTQCGKVMGTVFVESLLWTDSKMIQDYALACCEKWIVFNKKGSQTGQDRLQEVFLDCFESVWEIAGKHISQNFPHFRSRIQMEIREKQLCGDVARSIRERLLDLLIQFSLPPDHIDVSSPTSPDTVEVSSQTEVDTVCAECQTDGQPNADLSNEILSDWPVLNDAGWFGSRYRQPTSVNSPGSVDSSYYLTPEESFGSPVGTVRQSLYSQVQQADSGEFAVSPSTSWVHVTTKVPTKRSSPKPDSSARGTVLENFTDKPINWAENRKSPVGSIIRDHVRSPHSSQGTSSESEIHSTNVDTGKREVTRRKKHPSRTRYSKSLSPAVVSPLSSDLDFPGLSESMNVVKNTNKNAVTVKTGGKSLQGLAREWLTPSPDIDRSESGTELDVNEDLKRPVSQRSNSDEEDRSLHSLGFDTNKYKFVNRSEGSEKVEVHKNISSMARSDDSVNAKSKTTAVDWWGPDEVRANSKSETKAVDWWSPDEASDDGSNQVKVSSVGLESDKNGPKEPERTRGGKEDMGENQTVKENPNRLYEKESRNNIKDNDENHDTKKINSDEDYDSDDDEWEVMSSEDEDDSGVYRYVPAGSENGQPTKKQDKKKKPKPQPLSAFIKENKQFDSPEQAIQYEVERKPFTKPVWNPGKRKCTICGDSSHLIYNCPQKHHDFL